MKVFVIFHYRNFNSLVSYKNILCSFRLVLEGKAGKGLPQSSRLEFLEKFLADAEDSTSRLLQRGGIADLSLLRAQSVICQKSQEPSFWEVMESLQLWLLHKSFATITSLPELYFGFTRYILLVQSDFYEFRQQHQQLKTMEMNES